MSLSDLDALLKGVYPDTYREAAPEGLSRYVVWGQDGTAALANEAVPLAAAAVKDLVTGSAAAEVATAPKCVDALRAQLAAQAQSGV